MTTSSETNSMTPKTPARTTLMKHLKEIERRIYARIESRDGGELARARLDITTFFAIATVTDPKPRGIKTRMDQLMEALSVATGKTSSTEEGEFLTRVSIALFVTDEYVTAVERRVIQTARLLLAQIRSDISIATAVSRFGGDIVEMNNALKGSGLINASLDPTRRKLLLVDCEYIVNNIDILTYYGALLTALGKRLDVPELKMWLFNHHINYLTITKLICEQLKTLANLIDLENSQNKELETCFNKVIESLSPKSIDVDVIDQRVSAIVREPNFLKSLTQTTPKNLILDLKGH